MRFPRSVGAYQSPVRLPPIINNHGGDTLERHTILAKNRLINAG
jgi:hypothetical protein